MSASDGLSPEYEEAIRIGKAAYRITAPFLADALDDRFDRCASDEEVIRVMIAVGQLTRESAAIIRAATDFLSASTIDLMPVPVSETEAQRLSAAIRSIP